MKSAATADARISNPIQPIAADAALPATQIKCVAAELALLKALAAVTSHIIPIHRDAAMVKFTMMWIQKSAAEIRWSIKVIVAERPGIRPVSSAVRAKPLIQLRRSAAAIRLWPKENAAMAQHATLLAKSAAMGNAWTLERMNPIAEAAEMIAISI
jgi:hypothetical protein